MMAKTKTTIEERLADAADYEGLTVEDLATDAKLLKKHRIAQTKLTGAIIHHAHELNRQRMQALLDMASTRNDEIQKAENERFAITNTESEGERTMKTKTTKTTKTSEPVEIQKAKASTRKGEKIPAKPAAPARSLVFDKYAPTSVIRWMGTKKWDIADALRACKALMPDIAEATVRIQLNAGKKGERGEPAKLTRDEQKHVNALKK